MARRRLLTAQYLRMLLGERAAYRGQWARVVDKAGTDEISQAAVAKVIVEHVRSVGGGTDPGDYRLLKDRVYRALSGRALTPSTLGLIVDAFRFSEQDARQLWGLFLGTAAEETQMVPACKILPLTAAEDVWLRSQLAALWERFAVAEGGDHAGDMAVAAAIRAKLERAGWAPPT